jgi:hypothetical protein
VGFKEDADFARFVSVGAIGTEAVANRLRNQFNHQPIELERYAMANKVWQTKVKRLRLPDLLCVRCGLRVESRAKSKLKIMLSHSDTPGREWDSGGMRHDDLFAFLHTDINQDPPYCGAPIYFSTEALQASISHVKRSAPKAASEGSEVTLTWPCWVPTKSGRFLGVDDEGRIVFSGEDGRVQRYWQWRNWGGPRFVYSEPQDFFRGDEQVLAGVAEQSSNPVCSGNTWDLAAALHSGDVVERYAAVKATGAVELRGLGSTLSRISGNASEDWRVRLEAQVALARLEPDPWVRRIMNQISDPQTETDQQMEAVLAMSELPSEAAANALDRIAAKSDLPSELRAAAAWGLGQGAARNPELLLDHFVDPEPIVALHAISSVDELPSGLQQTLVGWMAEEGMNRASAAAQLLQRHGCVDSLLEATQIGDNACLWALRALGELPPALVRCLAGNRLTPEIEEVLLPMWLGQDDWLRQEGKEGLDALDVQKIRFR